MYFNEGKIDEILFQNQPEGVLYREEKLDENQKLLGFVDRFNERITKQKTLQIDSKIQKFSGSNVPQPFSIIVSKAKGSTFMIGIKNI